MWRCCGCGWSPAVTNRPHSSEGLPSGGFGTSASHACHGKSTTVGALLTVASQHPSAVNLCCSGVQGRSLVHAEGSGQTAAAMLVHTQQCHASRHVKAPVQGFLVAVHAHCPSSRQGGADSTSQTLAYDTLTGKAPKKEQCTPWRREALPAAQRPAASATGTGRPPASLCPRPRCWRQSPGQPPCARPCT